MTVKFGKRDALHLFPFLSQAMPGKEKANSVKA